MIAKCLKKVEQYCFLRGMFITSCYTIDDKLSEVTISKRLPIEFFFIIRRSKILQLQILFIVQKNHLRFVIPWFQPTVKRYIHCPLTEISCRDAPI